MYIKSIIYFVLLETSKICKNIHQSFESIKLKKHTHFFVSSQILDRAERHGFYPRLWLFFSPFLFPPKKRGNKKEEQLAKIVIKSHAFLLNLNFIYISPLFWNSITFDKFPTLKFDFLLCF